MTSAGLIPQVRGSGTGRGRVMGAVLMTGASGGPMRVR